MAIETDLADRKRAVGIGEQLAARMMNIVDEMLPTAPVYVPARRRRGHHARRQADSEARQRARQRISRR
jgi:hypothetical protein